MPNNKLKRATSVALSFSMLTSAPQIGNAADLVPNNGMISSTPPPPYQTAVAPNDATVGFSIKSFEAKISKALKPSKIVEKEKVKRKTLATEGNCGNGVTYTFAAETGTLTISKTGDGDGAMTDFGYPNYAPWTSYRSDIQSVIIENGVTSIGKYAFYDCQALETVVIGNGVTSIGNYAFSCCNSLTSITIPDSVTSIMNAAFYNCSSLTSITIPDSVISIGSGAFSSCKALETVVIPSSVTSIGDSAFSSCSGLTSVNIGNGVISIGKKLFDGCSGLTITLNNDYAISKFKDGISYNASNISVIIGDGVTSIGDAFGYCERLISVNIGNGVTSIGKSAFQNSGLTSITIPDSVTSIGEFAFHSCDKLTKVIIGNGVSNIGSFAFEDCKALTHLTIGNGLTFVNSCAFRYCENLVDVTYTGIFAPKYESFVYSVFSGCDKLTAVNVPYNYVGAKFCGLPVIKEPSPETISLSITPEVPTSDEPSISENSSSNTTVIAATVSTAITAIIAAIVGGFCYIKHKKHEKNTDLQSDLI